MNGKSVEASRIKFVVICVFILLFGIFLGKNYSPTTVWIFGWTPSMPLIFIALFCFLVGCVCGWGMALLLRKKMEEGEL